MTCSTRPGTLFPSVPLSSSLISVQKKLPAPPSPLPATLLLQIGRWWDLQKGISRKEQKIEAVRSKISHQIFQSIRLTGAKIIWFCRFLQNGNTSEFVHLCLSNTCQKKLFRLVLCYSAPSFTIEGLKARIFRKYLKNSIKTEKKILIIFPDYWENLKKKYQNCSIFSYISGAFYQPLKKYRLKKGVGMGRKRSTPQPSMRQAENVKNICLAHKKVIVVSKIKSDRLIHLCNFKKLSKPQVYYMTGRARKIPMQWRGRNCIAPAVE